MNDFNIMAYYNKKYIEIIFIKAIQSELLR